MRALVLAVGLAGCGRIHFDPLGGGSGIPGDGASDTVGDGSLGSCTRFSFELATGTPVDPTPIVSTGNELITWDIGANALRVIDYAGNAEGTVALTFDPTQDTLLWTGSQLMHGSIVTDAIQLDLVDLSGTVTPFATIPVPVADAFAMSRIPGGGYVLVWADGPSTDEKIQAVTLAADGTETAMPATLAVGRTDAYIAGTAYADVAGVMWDDASTTAEFEALGQTTPAWTNPGTSIAALAANASGFVAVAAGSPVVSVAIDPTGVTAGAPTTLVLAQAPTSIGAQGANFVVISESQSASQLGYPRLTLDQSGAPQGSESSIFSAAFSLSVETAAHSAYVDDVRTVAVLYFAIDSDPMFHEQVVQTCP